jgi:hypothetical protein
VGSDAGARRGLGRVRPEDAAALLVIASRRDVEAAVG